MPKGNPGDHLNTLSPKNENPMIASTIAKLRFPISMMGLLPSLANMNTDKAVAINCMEFDIRAL